MFVATLFSPIVLKPLTFTRVLMCVYIYVTNEACPPPWMTLSTLPGFPSIVLDLEMIIAMIAIIKPQC